MTRGRLVASWIAAARPARLDGVDSTRARTRGALVAALVTTALLLAGACGSGTPPVGGGPAVDATPPPEVTASSARSPLPAGTPGAGTPEVVIGTKDFGEQFLLGELYTQALRAKGFTVTLQQNVGGTEIIDSAFAADRIQLYPEYLGEVAASLADAPPAADPLGTYRTARAFEESQRGATVLDQTPYQNTDVVVVRRDLAEAHGLRSVADLAVLGAGGAGVRIAAQPPFRTRANGLVGLARVYDLDELELLAVAPDETYGALDAGQVQTADGFSTDAQLRSGRYVELDDPENVFGFQHVAPVVKQATLARSGPALAQTCNWVSSLLTVEAIRAMNEQVQLAGVDEATVAREFLARAGLR